MVVLDLQQEHYAESVFVDWALNNGIIDKRRITLLKLLMGRQFGNLIGYKIEVLVLLFVTDLVKLRHLVTLVALLKLILRGLLKFVVGSAFAWQIGLVWALVVTMWMENALVGAVKALV